MVYMFGPNKDSILRSVCLSVVYWIEANALVASRILRAKPPKPDIDLPRVTSLSLVGDAVSDPMTFSYRKQRRKEGREEEVRVLGVIAYESEHLLSERLCGALRSWDGNRDWYGLLYDLLPDSSDDRVADSLPYVSLHYLLYAYRVLGESPFFLREGRNVVASVLSATRELVVAIEGQEVGGLAKSLIGFAKSLTHDYLLPVSRGDISLWHFYYNIGFSKPRLITHFLLHPITQLSRELAKEYEKGYGFVYNMLSKSQRMSFIFSEINRNMLFSPGPPDQTREIGDVVAHLFGCSSQDECEGGKGDNNLSPRIAASATEQIIRALTDSLVFYSYKLLNVVSDGVVQIDKGSETAYVSYLREKVSPHYIYSQLVRSGDRAPCLLSAKQLEDLGMVGVVEMARRAIERVKEFYGGDADLDSYGFYVLPAHNLYTFSPNSGYLRVPFFGSKDKVREKAVRSASVEYWGEHVYYSALVDRLDVYMVPKDGGRGLPGAGFSIKPHDAFLSKDFYLEDISGALEPGSGGNGCPNPLLVAVSESGKASASFGRSDSFDQESVVYLFPPPANSRVRVYFSNTSDFYGSGAGKLPVPPIIYRSLSINRSKYLRSNVEFGDSSLFSSYTSSTPSLPLGSPILVTKGSAYRDVEDPISGDQSEFRRQLGRWGVYLEYASVALRALGQAISDNLSPDFRRSSTDRYWSAVHRATKSILSLSEDLTSKVPKLVESGKLLPPDKYSYLLLYPKSNANVSMCFRSGGHKPVAFHPAQSPSGSVMSALAQSTRSLVDVFQSVVDLESEIPGLGKRYLVTEWSLSISLPPYLRTQGLSTMLISDPMKQVDDSEFFLSVYSTDLSKGVENVKWSFFGDEPKRTMEGVQSQIRQGPVGEYISKVFLGYLSRLASGEALGDSRLLEDDTVFVERGAIYSYLVSLDLRLLDIEKHDVVFVRVPLVRIEPER